MTRHSIVTKAAAALIALTFAAPGDFAARTVAQKHPRRAAVNQREKNQKKRINEGVKDGTMTKDEAKEARGNLRDIKKEERAEVKANGGHLTKSEQKDLNKQLNQNSQEIHAEKHDGSVGAPVAPAAPTAQ